MPLYYGIVKIIYRISRGTNVNRIAFVPLELQKGIVNMKKLLSVLLSLILCASVVVTNPPVEIGDEISTITQSEQYEDNGETVSPCDDDPGHTGDAPA